MPSFVFCTLKWTNSTERGIDMGRKPKNVPYIGEVKVNITATSKERYERFIHTVKQMIIYSIEKELEEERKRKNLSNGNNETQGD
jgi:hypothetical protein